MLLKFFDEKSHHWDDKEKAAKNFLYLKNLKVKFLKLLANKLNRLHNTNYSIRAWDIMIGYWLIKFLAVSFDRWNIILESQNDIEKLHEPLVNNSNIADDSNMAEYLFYQDKWNELFIQKLFMYYKSKNLSKLSFKLNKNEKKKELNKKKNF